DNVELCNGKDDNCNGIKDEGFPNLGKPCMVGMGVCQRTGVYVCTLDGLGTVCNAVQGLPGPELCGNGLDDNCNGQVDEGFSMFGKPCSAGVGGCQRTGAYLCTPDPLSLYSSATPGAPPHAPCPTRLDHPSP